MKSFLLIVSIPHERGIVQYDTQSMLMLLPEGYRVIEREPDISIHPKEVLFSWKCEEITNQEPAKYAVGVIGENTRSNPPMDAG